MSKSKKQQKPAKKKEHAGPKPDAQKDDEKPFDFGGLPDRDLKKNLGCG